MEEKKFITWLKEHKTELIIAGVSIVLISTGVLLYTKKETLSLPAASTAKNIKNASLGKATLTPSYTSAISAPADFDTIRPYTTPKTPFDVSEHVRNLPVGRFHSAAKEAEAAAKGIELLPSQTLVDSYTKYAA